MRGGESGLLSHGNIVTEEIADNLTAMSMQLAGTGIHGTPDTTGDLTTSDSIGEGRGVMNVGRQGEQPVERGGAAHGAGI